MSGHSKWHQIKHKKAHTDGQKSKLFGRLVRDISIAARAGTDVATNAALREAIARAKKANLPQEKIANALVSPDTSSLQEVVYEGFGPGGASVLIQAATDNPNRTVSELRVIFKSHGGVLGGQGSVRWQFTATFTDRATHFTVRPEHRLQLPDKLLTEMQQLLASLAAYPDTVAITTNLSPPRSR